MKADVLAFAQAVSNDQAEAATLDRYYRDVVYDLCQRAIVTNFTLSAVTAGQVSITYPIDAIEVFAVFFDDRVLDKINDLRTLDWASRTWRDDRGMPVAWIEDDDAVRTVRPYPTPDVPSEPLIPVNGAPMGLDYPAYSAVLVHTERRDDLPMWLETAAAFQITALEFGRESDHRDPLFERLCRDVAELLLQLVVTGEE